MKKRRVHIMGLGGGAMSGIARVLKVRGVEVDGCDTKDSKRLAALRAFGVNVLIGHDPSHLDGIDQLIISRSEERRVGKECRSRWSPYH